MLHRKSCFGLTRVRFFIAGTQRASFTTRPFLFFFLFGTESGTRTMLPWKSTVIFCRLAERTWMFGCHSVMSFLGNSATRPEAVTLQPESMLASHVTTELSAPKALRARVHAVELTAGEASAPCARHVVAPITTARRLVFTALARATEALATARRTDARQPNGVAFFSGGMRPVAVLMASGGGEDERAVSVDENFSSPSLSSPGMSCTREGMPSSPDSSLSFCSEKRALPPRVVLPNSPISKRSAEASSNSSGVMSSSLAGDPSPILPSRVPSMAKTLPSSSTLAGDLS